MEKTISVAATVIGDVIGSRTYSDQATMFDDVDSALTRVNARVEALQPLHLTTGDEFQGAYRDLASALLVSLLLPLHMFADYRLRIGIGWGEITADPQRAPAGQSGEGWWSAREAIDEVARMQSSKGWPAGLRSRFHSDDEMKVAVVNAFLICRDQVLSRMDAKDARITLGLYNGKTQEEIAEDLGLGQSTVSSRQRTRGPGALLRAQESLTALLGKP